MRSKLFGVLLFIETAALAITAGVSFYYNSVADETDLNCFLIPAAACLVLGTVLYLLGIRKNSRPLRLKDSFQVVTFSWVVFSAFGMIPFLLYGTIDNVSDAFFETMSGFSTTGATVIENIDSQPHGILFWRSLMQWLGGLGIVVFTLAFIPSIAKGSKKMVLFAAEAPGLSVEKLSPKMQNTARSLWIIYIILTAMCAFCYWLGNMSVFDAVCHALTTVATGGFSTHQASIGYFQSSYIEYICSLFMILSGINFAIYHFAFTRRFDLVFRNEEFRCYIQMILVSVVIFFCLFQFAGNFNAVTEEQLAGMPQNWQDKLRTSLFHVATLLSNTGYQAENFNYDSWGLMFLVITFFLMITGGCAGSTSGGIKVIRIIVLYKYMKMAVKECIHPTGMYILKISKQPVETSSVRQVCIFFSLFILVFMGNMVLLSAAGLSLNDSMSAFLTCFSNFGPGSGLTGPDGTFAAVPAAAKWILSLDMLLGRLEIFTVFMLFTRNFWKSL